ncbi:hypothetical protein E4O93_05340 [Diaphorobacter sp. DS2]|nr:hypothetical protein E4O93_05340 [Diaphorobacter sp. DS2]
MLTHRSYENFRACVDDAPEGCHDAAKRIHTLLGDTCDRFMEEVRALGLKTDNCDLIYRVELALYDYLRASNPDETVFDVAEGFGQAMAGPARERVLQQAVRDRDSLRTMAASAS